MRLNIADPFEWLLGDHDCTAIFRKNAISVMIFMGKQTLHRTSAYQSGKCGHNLPIAVMISDEKPC
ncbi:MAG: hypothetical protein ACWA5U_04740 [bacterium]